ncbi:DUF2326 domain-containing protein [Xenorhabdus innexi]|uniref:DUF2326 domain-containing protein n=1 Tax=Xenorhabdus innexi TaxID=290109 RepID=A0A1N6MUH6_9GAMM|nr:DUF2326 domain-containing protein [Xenorhabdus innexi]PHM27537.1 hypothetical protein Xinn_03959 [Xenorhabdus innexi]SIP72437.1 conserved hypothetical protein [Xenorhabdus innexi]
MKLSKIYSNKSDLFEPIEFGPGLNVILAEIRLPENRLKDTHNLGKTTLGRLIDFVLLSKREKNFFLFKHMNTFEEFIFFLEIKIDEFSYVTIRRSVKEPSKICFKKHSGRHKDFSSLSIDKWDHKNISFDKAKILLDGFLDCQALSPWAFRNMLGYLLRTQKDYLDVFQLSKFLSKHSDWKPFLSHVLGFNSELISKLYKKENDLNQRKKNKDLLKTELGGSIDDISKIEGLLLLKQKESEKKQNLLNSFDFRGFDKEKTISLVDEINSKISELNESRYYLSQNKKKIKSSLKQGSILFNPDEAEILFKEAGVFFEGQIKKDFHQLISFNKAITEERNKYLQEELTSIDIELQEINRELNKLGKVRSENLSFLSSTDVFDKYKKYSDEMVILKADITSLEKQKQVIHRLQEIRTEVRNLKGECEQLQVSIELDVEKQNSESNSLFSSIRLYFSEIVNSVIDRNALLRVFPNKEGHLEFKADILDELGNSTSADLGFTYRKLLCIAFDMAVLRANSIHKFPRFVYHDGVFESLDDRKKENLLKVIRDYSDFGLQQIITLIDSDMPPHENIGKNAFNNEEIVLRLHDENENGRLFKMRTW